MNCLIFGPPGSGKGTQSEAICEKFDLEHLSTGEILREAGRRHTDYGKQANALMSEGKLVTDDLVNSIVREKVVELLAVDKGILFDGYPRTLEQARFLSSCLKEHGTKVLVVIVLEIEDEELVKRICGRRICGNCEASYNMYYVPPKVDGVCDICDSSLVQREDDNEEALRERLEVYHSQTATILDYFSEKDVLIKVEGNANVSDVRASVLSKISAKLGR